jgi:hypothetical protein
MDKGREKAYCSKMPSEAEQMPSERYSREKEISESVGCGIFRPFPFFTQRNQTTHALGDALRRVFIAWKYANMNLGGKFK